MFDILQKAGRGVKKFMSEKINTCKEILSSCLLYTSDAADE